MPYQKSINKFGRSTKVDDGVPTDIWDRSTQPIWLAPVGARIHQIASTSADDTAGGVGAQMLRIYGLKTWDVYGSSEDVIMDGTNNVATVNSYVIIHRMEVVPGAGQTSVNAGTITATADEDGTITAQIIPLKGQTQMAIYGFPSIQSICIRGFYASILEADMGVTVRYANLSMLLAPDPILAPTIFLVKHPVAVAMQGANPFRHPYDPPNVFDGPGILKMQATGSADDLDVSAGFDLTLINNQSAF